MRFVPVKIEILIAEDKLMSDFMGCNWETDPVAAGFVREFSYKISDKALSVTRIVPVPEQGTVTTQWVTADDIAKAWGELVASGAEHCGELIGLDSEEWDACVGTAILQQIFYGEELYG